MRRFRFPILQQRPADAPSPVPELGPEPLPKERKARRRGVHLHRVGGAPVWTAGGCWPGVTSVVAVRGYTLFRRPVRTVTLRLDGRAIATVRPGAAGMDAHGRAKQVFNIWADLSAVPPGVHRLSIRPSGLFARLHERGRRVVVTAPAPETADAANSDARLPPDLGPDIEQAVAALPSMARPAARGVLPDPVRSILLARGDQLGDLAISIPAVQRLRALFPAARITALLTAHNVDLGRACGLFDAIVELPFTENAALGRRVMGPEAQRALRDRLAPERFDLAIDLGEGAQSRLLLLLAGARFTYGFRHGDHGWLSASFELNTRDPASGLELLPPARKLMAMVDALGAMRPAPAGPTLPAPADPALLARHGIAAGERFILLHAGARLAYSRWPHFAELTRLLLDRTTAKVLLFTHDHAEEPRDLPQEQQGRLLRIGQPLPFAEFDALLAGAAVMVGNDSGPKHLAALRGTRVVSLHMARLNWNEWGQEGEGLILSRRVPCAGCGIGAHPEECGRDYQCLTGITAEEACAAVLSLL